MVSFATSKVLSALLVAYALPSASAGTLRSSAGRIRPDATTVRSAAMDSLPGYGKLFKSLAEQPMVALQDLMEMQAAMDAEMQTKKEDVNALAESFEALVDQAHQMSMGPSPSPSVSPHPSGTPTESPIGQPSAFASAAPSKENTTPTPTTAPSLAPSSSPSVGDTEMPSAGPSVSVAPPFSSPTLGETGVPTSRPTRAPSSSPTLVPNRAPSSAPTRDPTTQPTIRPTDFPSAFPSTKPSGGASTLPLEFEPTQSPTIEGCGISSNERITRILAILDDAADPTAIRNNIVPQGKATTWLLAQDERKVCPDDPKILQRWALAVVYFSTGGDDWLQCSGSPSATDACGSVAPFLGKERFLSTSNECEWAGISCITGCVTEVEFEKNNLAGTIPTEIALLNDLAIWGMEQGNLTSTIPTEIGLMTNLIFLDFDFNALTGSLTSELLSLSSLTQLDLNNNQLTGSIDGIGVFPDMEFLQLHDNFFTGTVPEAVGSFSNLAAFTLHETDIGGVMPPSVCDLLITEGRGGVLGSLIADCSQRDNFTDPDIECDCCTDCRST
jgi:hypothetical protein